MKLDCELYANSLWAAKNGLLQKAKLKGPSVTANEMSCYTHIPVVAVVMFLLLPEVLGPSAELEKQLKSLLLFYGYTEIKPFLDRH